MKEEEWKKKLTKKQFKVLRQGGTDLPFTGKLYLNKNPGFYLCAGCGNKLFNSKTKFNSFSGWPSFYKAHPKSVKLKLDNSLGMKRTEVLCAKCGGHLGHVFDDGPKPSGKRFCINSTSLEFRKD